MRPLNRDFYLRDTLTVAAELLGKYLVREVDGTCLIGRITETEAYIGAIDKACHAYGGRITPRTETLFEQAGTAYVYLIYGMYHCMNVVTEPKGTAAAVLLRGVEFVRGMESASRLRYGLPLHALSKLQQKNFANGPGKLCKAMGITRDMNKQDLCDGAFFITDEVAGIPNPVFKIDTSPRIGIDYAEEAKDFLWRFVIEDRIKKSKLP